MIPLQQARQAFTRSFGVLPALSVQAPGRVNLIGEHTDYNDGFVLPCAIDFHTVVCGSPRSDGQVRVLAVDHGGEQEAFVLDGSIEKRAAPGWANYVRGVLAAIVGAGHVPTGADLAISGNVPQGAGLSSSASLTVAVGQFFNTLNDLSIAPTDIALIGQWAENHFVGAQTGVMDQLISVMGEAGNAKLIDCRSLEARAVPMPEGLAIVIIDSRVQRGLVGSAYNTRRAECESAAAHFGVRALRDLSMSTLESAAHSLDPVIYRRARHIVSDSQRALDLAQALQHGDRRAISALMAASHASMRNDFDISVPPVDALVHIVTQVVGDSGGARMTGGGFGGCVVALVPRECVAAVRGAVADRYRAITGWDAVVHVCRASPGAAVCE